MQTRITVALVRRLLDQPPAKDTSVFDVVLPRFAFRVKPPRQTGAKPAALYFIRYTGADGAERRMKIGGPDTMSVDDARKTAEAKLAVVDAGGDPKKERDKARGALTIREVAEAYLVSPKFKGKTAKVQSNDRARIKDHILHHIGGEKAEGISAQVARRMRQQVSTDTRRNKRKRQLGGPGAARKVLRLLAAILRWAKDEGLIAELPFTLRELELGGDGSRDAVITTPEEYAALFTTMAEMVAAGSLRPEARAFFVLVASTGLRRGEAQSLRWGQVNLQRRQITLTGSKGGKLARQRGTGGTQTEIIGLPPVAAAAIAELRPESVTQDTLVFPPFAVNNFR
jgi:integrase